MPGSNFGKLGTNGHVLPDPTPCQTLNFKGEPIDTEGWLFRDRADRWSRGKRQKSAFSGHDGEVHGYA